MLGKGRAVCQLGPDILGKAPQVVVAFLNGRKSSPRGTDLHGHNARPVPCGHAKLLRAHRSDNAPGSRGRRLNNLHRPADRHEKPGLILDDLGEAALGLPMRQRARLKAGDLEAGLTIDA